MQTSREDFFHRRQVEFTRVRIVQRQIGMAGGGAHHQHIGHDDRCQDHPFGDHRRSATQRTDGPDQRGKGDGGRDKADTNFQEHFAKIRRRSKRGHVAL